MSFSTFAIAGVGNIGSFITEELLKQKDAGKATEVVVLTRSTSTNDATKELAAKGAKIAPVDYTSKASLTAALTGVEVVICTFSHLFLEGEQILAEAAKAAGAKLFVPSEFGNPTENAEHGPLVAKKNFQGKLREIGLPYALFFTGPWTDFCFVGFMGLDLTSGKVIAGGDGNVPISWTSRRDVGRFVAYALTTLPSEKIAGRTFRVEGERASLNEIYKAYEAKTGKKLEVTYKSIPDLQTAFASNPQDIASVLHFAWALGGGAVGKAEDVTNGEFPAFNPGKVLEVLKV